MLDTIDTGALQVCGVDFFIASTLQPGELAELLQPMGGIDFKLIVISNRGTQVWPKGSLYTNLTDVYGCRFEGENLTAQKVVELQSKLINHCTVCSIEMLYSLGDKKLYSLAQGQ
jgi:isocitrate dehydrogenase